MLAAVDYQTSRDVFGTFLGNADLAGPPDGMLAEAAVGDAGGHPAGH